MNRYSQEVIDKVQALRAAGNTYGEIRKELDLNIPKSSLSYICQNVSLPKEYASRIKQLNILGLTKGRNIAEKNLPISKTIHSVNIGKVALAMLCLGEASKYNPIKTRSFSLGNSDHRIIKIFLELLKSCYPFTIEKIRATVQCRADQDPSALQRFWEQETGIPSRLFYKPQIDPRTKGKPTIKKNYRGVLRVYYFDTRIQLELESLANLIYNQLRP